MAKELPLKWSVIILPFIEGIVCSAGDNSPFYSECVKNCKIEICDAGEHSLYQYSLLGFSFSLWSCLENCEYNCQWETVEAFKRRNWDIPQFRGKWPFIRVLGFQEPASVFFSIMNFFITLKLLIWFRRKAAKSSYFFSIWNTFGLLQLNAWVWSSVYHARDTEVTEKLDYMSAFAVVLFSLYTVGLRYISASFDKRALFWSVFCSLVGLNHLSYLWFYKFDYAYNMKLNCLVGGLGLLLWVLWSALHFHSQPFVWKVFLFSVLSCSSMLLEIGDFPPIFWLIDAHALWHSTTMFINILFYMFIIDDCNSFSKRDVEKIPVSHKTK